MTHDSDDQDLQLTRLLQAVRADADPALWTRVRARIVARERGPDWLRWAMRPAALVASLALLIVSSAIVLTYEVQTAPSSDETYATVGEALLAERDDQAAAAPAPSEPGAGAARDSGGGR